MSADTLPEGFRVETLRKNHPRKSFHSGEKQVDEWLATKALQQQDKHLSMTKVLVDEGGSIAGYYTLATGEIDFDALPPEETAKLPHRRLPVAIMAWFGIAEYRQRQGLGRVLFAHALLECYEGGKTFPFVAVIIDCLNDRLKIYYQRWKFVELPQTPHRLYLSAALLKAMVEAF